MVTVLSGQRVMCPKPLRSCVDIWCEEKLLYFLGLLESPRKRTGCPWLLSADCNTSVKLHQGLWNQIQRVKGTAGDAAGTQVPDNLNTQKSCCCYWTSLTCKEDKGPGSLSVVLMGFECMHLHLLVTVLRRSWEKITAEVKSRWDFKGEEKWWNLIVWQNNVLKEH